MSVDVGLHSRIKNLEIIDLGMDAGKMEGSPDI